MRVYDVNHPAHASLPIGRLKPCEWRGLEKAIQKYMQRRSK